LKRLGELDTIESTTKTASTKQPKTTNQHRARAPKGLDRPEGSPGKEQMSRGHDKHRDQTETVNIDDRTENADPKMHWAKRKNAYSGHKQAVKLS
jgi:hypothetical protein